MSLNDGLFKFPTCHVSTSVLEVVKLVQNTIKEALEVKGQIMSECIYEIINFTKYHPKNWIDFYPGRFYRLGTLFLSIEQY